MRARYGAAPVHLLAHLAALALAGWALLAILGVGNWPGILLWMVGAVVVHDAVLWPAYTVLDRAARRGRPTRRVNYVRVPAGLSALLLLAFFPVVCGKGTSAYSRVSGTAWDGYAARWLAVSAALFAAAGVVYLLRGRPRATRP